MKFIKDKYYKDSINYDKLPELIEGNVTHLGDMTVFGNYIPVIMMHAKKPNRTKGHKEFPFLFFNKDHLVISAMDAETFEAYRYQDAVHCLNCNEVIYSSYRHGFKSCRDNCVSIDGGRDYTKISYNKKSAFINGKIDFLTGTFILNHKKSKLKQKLNYHLSTLKYILNAIKKAIK